MATKALSMVAVVALGLVLAGVLGGCALTTPRIDEATGTTLAERCADYRVTAATYDALALERQLSEIEVALAQAARVFIATKCPPGPAPAAAVAAIAPAA